MKLSKDAVQLYKTLTNAQKEAWAIPVRAGFRPVLILNGKRKHEIIKNLVLSHTKANTTIRALKDKVEAIIKMLP